MDEATEQETPAVERPVEECCEAEPECCKRRRGGMAGGLLGGAIIAGALAVFITRLRAKEGAQGPWQAGEGSLQEEMPDRARGAVGGDVVSRLKGFWAALRERLHYAAAETKEGMVEGQQEARARYEIMTKRRRPR